jgi:hypothetical protein
VAAAISRADQTLVPSHASHIRRQWSLLALVAATLACALAPTSAVAADTGVVPDTSPVPVEPSTGPEGEVVSSSIVRLSPMLSVRSAQIRGGRLAIAGRLARGSTGKVRGVARYRGGERRFATRVDPMGRISIHKRLPGGKEAQTARVKLVYGGSGLFRKQRVTLRVRHGDGRRGFAGPSVVATLGS